MESNIKSMQVKVNLRQVSPSVSKGMAREHKTPIDRPEPKGGENRGSMGGELMLMGLIIYSVHERTLFEHGNKKILTHAKPADILRPKIIPRI
jgi:putative redox protein